MEGVCSSECAGYGGEAGRQGCRGARGDPGEAGSVCSTLGPAQRVDQGSVSWGYEAQFSSWIAGIRFVWRRYLSACSAFLPSYQSLSNF